MTTTPEDEIPAQHLGSPRVVDSAYGSPNSTVSLTQDVVDFQLEYGRSYTTEEEYLLPVDEREKARLDLFHCCVKLILNSKSSLAPMTVGGRVLDLGTGTGIWAIELAESDPASVVIGVDLAPIQPDFVPPNLEFQIEDIEMQWTWSYDFTFIRARQLGGSIKDWPCLIRQCNQYVVDSQPTVSSKLILKMIGAYRVCEFLEGVEGLLLKCLIERLAWSLLEVQVYLAEIREAAKTHGFHLVCDLHVVFGKKPF
ncbi:putative sam dependent [Phaeomoniella chlamydospora]|uniref:Putative sam dependent n=1 Tax=Phaeomoniella chlamydospora TaxID=158046 RepID=A0A0G2EJZ0_PHACM|nr:putative sam dependent [Phaeomoniella chlamydospora]